MATMTDRVTSVDTVGEADSVEQLRARIRELEGQLRTASWDRPPHVVGGTTALKVVTAALAAVVVLMALPAFITLRRWYWWWR
jgi:hypothetical protein